MNLKDLTEKQQSKVFIFEKWGCVQTLTETVIFGVDHKGDIKILFKLPKPVIPPVSEMIDV